MLPNIMQQLRRRVARRLPLLASDHEDLVSQTVTDLARWLKTHPETVVPGNVAALERLAARILNRRIADLFRDATRRWGTVGEEVLEHVPSPTASVERRVLVEKLLRLTAAFIATLDDDERELVMMGSGEADESRALKDVERKRLQRIRERLDNFISERVGAKPADLLRGGD